MSYPEIPIPIPINKSIRDLSSKEAKIFNHWFAENIERRISVLEENVKSDARYLFWYADRSRESLIELGQWLNDNLAAVEQTKEDVESSIARNKAPDWLAEFMRTTAAAKRFSDETYRKCFDVGVYFGETMRKAVPSLKWTYRTSKTFLDKNFPILERDPKKASLNPIDLVQGVAGKLLRAEATPQKLVDVFDVWQKIFQ